MSAPLAQPVFLGSLLQGIAAVPNDVPLTDITLDSRQVIPGGLFLACRGARSHGLDFAADVARRGAAAILFEPDEARSVPNLPSDIIVAPVPNLAARASLLADRFFASPSRALDVIGVTGTNGKTTCAWLLAQALTACEHPTAYLGTLGATFAGHAVAGELTTPDAVTVQRQLAGFATRGARGVAMEVSSHALVQHRVTAVHFDAAVFTNLTRDHLDFHGDMARYGLAKASLFERDDIRLRVFNVDDSFGAALAARPRFSGRIACSRAIPDAAMAPADLARQGRYVRAHSISYTDSGTRFGLDSSFGTAVVETPLIGSFNVDNVLAAMAVLLGSNLPLGKCVAAMRQLAAPSGRLETFSAAGRPLVVVDSAHTPDALQKALQVLRQHCSGRLTLVFGCGGDRDRGKRPLMGALAVQLADAVILTDDNPRSESGDAIIADIRAGMGADPVTVIRDRESAIREAVAKARAGDVVLVAGKGHETCQIIGDQRRSFSDQVVARQALGLDAAAGQAAPA